MLPPSDDADVLQCLRSGEAFSRQVLRQVDTEMRRERGQRPRLVFARLLGGRGLMRDILSDAFQEHVCTLVHAPSLLRGEEDDGYAVFFCGGHGQTKGPAPLLAEVQHVAEGDAWPSFSGAIRVTSYDYVLPGGEPDDLLRWPAICVGRSQRQREGDNRRKGQRVAKAAARAAVED